MSQARFQLSGLIPATHTPFDRDGALNLDIVEHQAAYLAGQGISTVFIGGSTGESHSLTLPERQQLAQRWLEVTQGSRMEVVVHVGSNCIADSQILAAHAQKLGAIAVAALAPSYFKPKDVAVLVDCCAEIAGAAAETPFYFYDIPSMTGVQLSMPRFLEAVELRIPNLAGLKFTNMDLMSFQLCRAAARGQFNILWGVDEALLAALSLGATGAVGSTYNFAAPLYQRIMAAYQQHDFATARDQQLRSIRLVELLASRGYMASAKAMMCRQGVDVGPPRLPNARLSAVEMAELEADLEAFGPV